MFDSTTPTQLTALSAFRGFTGTCLGSVPWGSTSASYHASICAVGLPAVACLLPSHFPSEAKQAPDCYGIRRTYFETNQVSQDPCNILVTGKR